MSGSGEVHQIERVEVEDLHMIGKKGWRRIWTWTRGSHGLWPKKRLKILQNEFVDRE